MFSPFLLVMILVCSSYVDAQDYGGSCSPSSPCTGNLCCSQWGFCGSTDAYCGTGCQATAGRCGTSTTPVTSAPVTSSPVTTAAPGTSTTGNTAGSCTKNSDCAPGACCSQWGFCGTGASYCSSTATTGSVSTTATTATTGSTSTTATVSSTGSTSTSTTGPPPPSGTVKAIYIDYKLDYNNPANTVTQAIDAGYTLIILAFYLSSGPTDMAGYWGGLGASAQQSVIQYAHSKGAKIIVSWGGSTQGQYDSLSASAQGNAVGTWAVNNNLDGVDFDLEGFAPGFSYGSMTPTQTVQWVADITNAARSVLGSSRIITHAPVAPYFGPANGNTWVGASGGYNSVYALAPSIDYFLVQFYNQDCYTTYQSVFTNSASQCNGQGNNYPGTSVAEIHSYTVNGYQIPYSKLIVGKPVLTSDASNGYVDPSTLHSWFVQASSDIGWNSGVMGWMWEDATDNTNWIQAVYP